MQGAANLASKDLAFDFLRRGQGALGVHRDECVQSCLDGLDPVEAGLRELDR